MPHDWSGRVIKDRVAWNYSAQLSACIDNQKKYLRPNGLLFQPKILVNFLWAIMNSIISSKL